MLKMRDEVICAMRQAFGFYSSQIRRKNLTARWRNTSLWLKGCYRYRLRVNVPLPGKFNFDVGINEKNRATQRKEKREREKGEKEKEKLNWVRIVISNLSESFSFYFFFFSFHFHCFFLVLLNAGQWGFHRLYKSVKSRKDYPIIRQLDEQNVRQSDRVLPDSCLFSIPSFLFLSAMLRSSFPSLFSLLSRQTSSVPQQSCRALYSSSLRDTVANDFYSSSLFSSLLPPVAVDWWARNDNFPSLSFCCCFFFLSFAYLNEHFLRPSAAHADNGFLKAVGLRASSTHSISDSPSLSHRLFF